MGTGDYKNYDQESAFNFSKVDYITFSIYDLLRAKCIGTKEQIKKVYDKIR